MLELNAYRAICAEVEARHAQLVAVSKTRPNEDIWTLYEAGQRIFGENRVQELLPKYEALPKDIEWHLIGHLQRNKVKYIAPFVRLIHSVDSLDLLQEIDKQALKNNRILDCLLQFHVAQEETKFGLDWDEALALLQSETFASLQNCRIVGIMGMASLTEDTAQIRREFKQLHDFFLRLRQDYFAEKNYFTTLSMGMSSDYTIALEEGSTMVRIGSKLFPK